jgi:dipeptidyl aminopeptidase/acylaminoacyl peptidase
MHFRWVEEVALAPAGDRVAYTVKRADAHRNGYVADVWVHDVVTGAVQVITPLQQGRASSLAWSRDGRVLAYAWQDDGHAAVHLWSAQGGDTVIHRLTGPAMTALDWSPDGTRLVGVRWTPTRSDGEATPGTGIPQPTVRVIRRLRYKLEGIGFVHDRFAQLWLLEAATGVLTQLTDAERDCSEPRFSHSGRQIAYIITAREQNEPLGQGQIFIYDLPHRAARPLVPDWVGACRSPVWSPDDRHIAFAGHTEPPPTSHRVFLKAAIADVAAGQARLLAPHLDQAVGNYAVSDQRQPLSNVTVKWPAGSPWIYFLLTEQGATHLYRIDADGHYQRLVDGPCVCFDYSPSADGRRVAVGVADPLNPGDVYLWEEPGGALRRLTTLNPWLRDRWLVTPEEYWFEGLDGHPVHGWIMKPPTFDDRLAYPTVVHVHCSMFSWDFSLEFQCLASSGYVLAYFNQRGTTAGYGQAWTRASEGDQGGAEYEEIMRGVDDLVRRPWIDADRLGITGGSCGGFLTTWVVGHTSRFKAAVTDRSIANWISFGGTSDFGPENLVRETGTDPWSDLAKVWRQSPLAYVDHVRTPLLILHSDGDHRCPIAEAEQLFAALRWRGRPVEFVWFEGENHGLSRAGRPGNRIERLRRILGWFHRHLGGDPGPWSS